MVQYHRLLKATDHFATKLAPRYVGPYFVTSYVSPIILTLKDDWY